MRVVLVPVVALLASSFLAPAFADHSASVCTDVVTIGTGAASLYLVRDLDEELWVYLETNGHAGLQQGGIAWYEFGTGWPGDECWDRVIATGEHIENPDLIIL